YGRDALENRRLLRRRGGRRRQHAALPHGAHHDRRARRRRRRHGRGHVPADLRHGERGAIGPEQAGKRPGRGEGRPQGAGAGGTVGSVRFANDGSSIHWRGKRGRNLTWRLTTACTRRHQHTIGRDVRPTLTTAKGIESATTVRRSGWLSEHRSSGVFTPKLESGPVHGLLCHTANVAG